MIKWRCCPRLVQFHGFRSVEVLLDTPPKCPKNCPAAKGDSVQISLSRRVSFFMMKPRLCPSQDQSSPVQSRRPLGFGQVFSDQPAASRLEHCELVCLNSTWNLGFPLSLKIVSQREAGLSGVECLVRIWNFIVTLGVISVSSASYPAGSRKPLIRWIGKTQTNGSDVKSKVVDIKAMRFPLLEARSWQEAKSNLVTVALGKDDRIAWCWTLGPPAGPSRGVKFVTLTRSSLARHVALPDHGVGLDGQSCSCLIVGWPWVDLCLGRFGGVTEVVSEHGFVHASGTHDLIGCLGSIVRLLVRIARVMRLLIGTLRDENLKVEGVRGQTQTRSERGETDSERLDSGMDWTDGSRQDFVGKGLHQ
ncbi:hypothetical protein YC2023_072366 [Brassica napus]